MNLGEVHLRQFLTATGPRSPFAGAENLYPGVCRNNIFISLYTARLQCRRTTRNHKLFREQYGYDPIWKVTGIRVVTSHYVT